MNLIRKVFVDTDDGGVGNQGGGRKRKEGCEDIYDSNTFSDSRYAETIWNEECIKLLV